MRCSVPACGIICSIWEDINKSVPQPVFDNAGVYDQVGLCSDYGTLGTTWSVGWPDNNTYVYNANAFTLNPNSAYTFVMIANSNGTIEFAVYSGSDTSVSDVSLLLWSHWYHTGGTEFIIENWYESSNSNVYADYTNYEEVYSTTDQSWPDWNFNFTWNSLGDWGAWSAGSLPSGIQTQILIDKLNVTIANEWFLLTAGEQLGDGSLYFIGLYPGNSMNLNGYVYKAYSSAPQDIVSLTMIDVPSGWQYSFSPQSGVPEFQYGLSLSVPSNANTGLYTLTVEANYNGLITKADFQIKVLQSSSGGGGGGCVAWGTWILTPNGYVPVQRLKIGEPILEYNLSTATLQLGFLYGNNKTEVNSVLDINNGLLIVTLTDQPVYIKNSTFVGWIRDPINLTLNDQLFDPVNGTWIQVNSVSILYEHILVFDVVTSSINNFIGNGILLDKKAP